MKRRIVVLTAVLLASWNCSAWAQVALGKYRERVEIVPGQKVKGSIVVHNRSGKTVSLKAYLKDIKFVPPFNGKKEILPAGSTDYSINKWIKVSPDSFSVPADGQQTVNYIVSVPEGAKGSYYGTVYFEKNTEGKIENNAIGIAVSWGYTLFLETKDGQKETEIGGVSFSGGAIQGNISNSGDVLLVCTPNFYVMDEKGVVLDRGALQDFFLPAGEQTVFNMRVPPKIPAGKYTAFLQFDFGDAALLLREIDFSKNESGEVKISAVR